MQPLVLVNAVGLTPRLLPFAPRLHALAQAGWCVPLREVLPAVTCTAQATILRSRSPEEHGIVTAGCLLLSARPDITHVYLPNLDYDPQRFGPQGTDMPKHVRELDEACAPLLDAAKAVGARVWLVSVYGHCQVSRPVYPNRVLREA